MCPPFAIRGDSAEDENRSASACAAATPARIKPRSDIRYVGLNDNRIHRSDIRYIRLNDNRIHRSDIRCVRLNDNRRHRSDIR